MKRMRAKDDPQLSLDLASVHSRESKPVGRRKASVTTLKNYAHKKQNSAKLSALRKVLEHAKSLSW